MLILLRDFLSKILNQVLSTLALRARRMWRAGWRKEQFYRSSEARARLKLFSQTVRHFRRKSPHS